VTGQDEKRLFKDLVEKAKYKLVPTRENRFWAVDWNKLVGDWNREVKKQLRIGGGGSILFLKTATHPMDYNKQKQSDTTAFNTMNAPSGVPGKSHMDLSKEVRDGLRSETAVVQQAFKPAPTAAPPTAPRDGGIRPPQDHVGHSASSYAGRAPALPKSTKQPGQPNRSTCNLCSGSREGHKPNTDFLSAEYQKCPHT